MGTFFFRQIFFSSSKLNDRSLSKNYVKSHIVFFILFCFFQEISHQVMHKNFMNYGHLFSPLVIDKMWLLFKRANKIYIQMYCFLLQICMCQLSSVSTPDYTPTRRPTNASPGRTRDLRSPLHSATLHYNQERRRARATNTL